MTVRLLMTGFQWMPMMLTYSLGGTTWNNGIQISADFCPSQERAAEPLWWLVWFLYQSPVGDLILGLRSRRICVYCYPFFCACEIAVSSSIKDFFSLPHVSAGKRSSPSMTFDFDWTHTNNINLIRHIHAVTMTSHHHLKAHWHNSLLVWGKTAKGRILLSLHVIN